MHYSEEGKCNTLIITKDFLTLQIKRRDETFFKKEKIKCSKNNNVIISIVLLIRGET